MAVIDYRVEETNRGRIIVRVFHGTLNKDDILNSFKHMLEVKMIGPKCKGLITDLSHSEVEMDISQLEQMLDFINNNEILSSIKLAVVANTPRKIMLPTLANFKVGDKLIPFSSLEAAMEWMLK